MTDTREIAAARPAVNFGPAVKVIAVLGLVVAYAMSAALMTAGYLPPTVTWAGVALIPGVVFLAITSPLFLPAETTRQRWFLIGFGATCYAVGMGLVAWQGWV